MTAATALIERYPAYREAQEHRRREEEIVRQRWQLARQTTWLTLLVVSFLIFYLIDIMQQSMAIAMVRY